MGEKLALFRSACDNKLQVLLVNFCFHVLCSHVLSLSIDSIYLPKVYTIHTSLTPPTFIGCSIKKVVGGEGGRMRGEGEGRGWEGEGERVGG